MGASQYLKALAGPPATRRGGFEGIATKVSESEIDLSEGRIAESLERLEAHLAHQVELSGNPEMGTLVKKVAADAHEGLIRLAQEGANAWLSLALANGVREVIIADGSRPVLFVQDDQIDIESPNLRDWAGMAARVRSAVTGVARSVGRINQSELPQSFAGTGFMIRDGVIATNRHVLEEIAEPDHEAADGSGWRLNRDVTIDFSGEFDRLSDPEKRFGIGRVLFAGADPIKGTLDPRKLDVAILELQERSDAAFPKPLRLAADTAVPAVDTPVYILGFPGRCDPRHESASVCSRIYANTYGFKRWAPGQVALAAGEHPLDLETKWVFTHDASTLAGNSGSCVVDLESDGATVVGIHFGGRRRLENFAHAISRIMDRL